MKNVMLIAYFYDPFPGVGAKRMTYWANNLAEHGFLPIVVTATEDATAPKGGELHIVKDEGSTGGLIKDQGKSWLPSLRTFIGSYDNPVDAVVITGGPFMHMEIAEDCRRKFNCKVLLDYRDPFAVNPRFEQASVKVWSKRRLEKKFAKSADAIISVSEYCLGLIETAGKNTYVIDNGYDETSMPTPASGEANMFVYAGSFYVDRDPAPLLDELMNHEETYRFVHVGQPYEPNARYQGWTGFEEKGMVTYVEAMNVINACDVAVMIVSGDPFESTTKVFDYMAMNKKILVVSVKRMQKGALTEILDGYPNVVFCENAPVSIRSGLSELNRMEAQPYDASRWSRKAGLNKLVEGLKAVL